MKPSTAAFEPSNSLLSRTYLGLIIAQFLAAFNDQAIHASSMFFAIHMEILRLDKAISLMPVLFFAPWAIFCTLAGYLADRYSKRTSLVFWKIAEVGICLIALLGFALGSVWGNHWGPWIVLSTVFLMGTHSAFFVPAKYGAMPEILTPQQLSMGNGILESSSFLAVILGTVSGGMLSYYCRRHEYIIGLILVALAVIGAAASLLIGRIPAANPSRPFPKNLFKPLGDNLRTLIRSRPLALAVVGIAFFTFMVAFMRATMYMHGESQDPRWNELKTSIVVATVALGVGLGSPLAGKLSGGKVELGLVPLGAIGMIIATLIAAFTTFDMYALIVGLVLIGFFSGFYIVPLYTLLQHRAPKTSKGDLIATSNFINVVGATLASLLFFGLVQAAKLTGIARPVPQQEVAEGVLTNLLLRQGQPAYFELRRSADAAKPFLRVGRPTRSSGIPDDVEDARKRNAAFQADEDVHNGMLVKVSGYTLRDVQHYEVRPADQPLVDAYDRALVPRFLFIGASVLTLGVLIILCRRLPDFFVRSLLWIRSYSQGRARVVGLNNLPSEGPVILATNCDRFETCMNVIAATDRFTRFVLFESADDPQPRPLLRYLARRTGLIALRPGSMTPQERARALGRAVRSLREGSLLGVTAAGENVYEAESFLRDLRAEEPVTVLPVYCGAVGSVDETATSRRRLRVVIGHPVERGASEAEIQEHIRFLGEWIDQAETAGSTPATIAIPDGVFARNTEAAAPTSGSSP